MTREDAVTLTAPVKDGYMVVHIGYGITQPAHPEGYFSVTADIYSSKRAFEIGSTHAIHSGGCLHKQVLAAFPELAPIVRLHMADVQTGEPMHAESNAWYRYKASRPDLFPPPTYGYPDVYKHQLDERGLPDTDEGKRRYHYLLACEILRVDEIPDSILDTDPEDERSFEEQVKDSFLWFVDEQRERWAQEAKEARALIDELAARSVDVPADEAGSHEIDEWSHVFDGDLRVSASLSGTGHRSGVGTYYVYTVNVSAPRDDGNGRATYRSEYGGSVADYDEGKVDAREAALGVLHELSEYVYQSADELAQEFGIEEDPRERSEEERQTVAAMRRAQRFVDKVSRAIETNREVFA